MWEEKQPASLPCQDSREETDAEARHDSAKHHDFKASSTRLDGSSEAEDGGAPEEGPPSPEDVPDPAGSQRGHESPNLEDGDHGPDLVLCRIVKVGFEVAVGMYGVRNIVTSGISLASSASCQRTIRFTTDF